MGRVRIAERRMEGRASDVAERIGARGGRDIVEERVTSSQCRCDTRGHCVAMSEDSYGHLKKGEVEIPSRDPT